MPVTQEPPAATRLNKGQTDFALYFREPSMETSCQLLYLDTMAAIRSPMMPAFQLAGTSSRLSLLLFHSRKFRMSPNQLLLSYALRYPGWIVLSVLLDFSSALFSGVGTALIVPLVLGL